MKKEEVKAVALEDSQEAADEPASDVTETVEEKIDSAAGEAAAEPEEPAAASETAVVAKETPVAAVEEEKPPVIVKVAAGPDPSIPEDSTTIVSKQSVEPTPKPRLAGGPMAVCPSWKSLIDKIGASIQKGGQEISVVVSKPFKSETMAGWVSSTCEAAQKPVSVVAAVDRKITQSMKKLASFGELPSVGDSLAGNLKSADEQITRSARKLINSIFA